MNALGKYIFSVTIAAILFSTLMSLLDRKNCNSILLRIIGGLFLTFTVISPVADIKIDEFLDIPLDFSQQGNQIAEHGFDIMKNQLRDNIKAQCEAYILDKAMTYQVELSVEVTLSHDETPIPSAVQLRGAVSPYVKNALQTWLCNEMGIPKENQLWSE